MEREQENIINIKIQTLDSQHSLSIRKNALVQELKEKIQELFSVPVLNQRLIYQGKPIQNTEKLKNYKIQDDSVIHLAVKITDDQGNNNTNQQQQQQQQNNNTNTNDDRNPREDIPLIGVRRPPGHRHRRRIPHFDFSDCYETIYQNIQTIQNLQNCKSSYNDNQSMIIKPFNLSKAKYEVGQWLDAKDTNEEWLEAQVLQIRNNSQALIHYNGSSSRWDEWIDFSSKRLAYFKTYTTQAPNTLFLSPNPTTICDGSIDMQQHRSIDVFYYLEKATAIMNDLTMSINHMTKIRRKKNEDSSTQQEEVKESNFNQIETEILFLTTQIIPVMDRCGRLMTDLSLQLSHLVLNPNLYPQLLLLHNNTNAEISDSMSCTSGYSMYTNESSSLSSFTNNLRFMRDQNIARDLQGSNNRTNIQGGQNSNQVIRNYTNSSSGNNPNTIINQSTITSNANGNHTALPKYYLNSSSNELPFIQRLNFSNTLHPNYITTLGNYDAFPKINLQIPPILNPNDIPYVNAYNPLDDQNIYIYNRNVYVDQQPPSQLQQLQQQQSQAQSTPQHQHNTISNANSNTIANQSSFSSSNIPQRTYSYQIHKTDETHINEIYPNKSTNHFNGKDCIMEDNKSNSEEIGENNQAGNNSSIMSNHNNIIAQNINNNTFLIRSLQSRKTGSVKSGRSNMSSDQMSAKQSRHTKMDNESMNDMPINLLSLNKENNYSENYMENMSYKSDKNASLKNNHLSCKSVSEVNEFEESLEEDNENKKQNCTISSHHSDESDYVNEYLEGEKNDNNTNGNGNTKSNGNGNGGDSKKK